MVNALSIDVEEHFQVSAFESVIKVDRWEQHESRVENNTRLILDILEEKHIHATFFVLAWIAERHPKLIKAIHNKGHEVASHGYKHQRVYTQTPEQFRQETNRSKKILEDTIGHIIMGYRAASYSITSESLWALDILIEEGFSYDSSIFPVWHDRYGIPNAERFSHIIRRKSGNILEYPLSTLRFGRMNVPVGGGGYLRLFPYSITKWAINQINTREQKPAIVYLHPWEVDPDQPRIDGSFVSKFRHYVNLKKTENTVRNLLEDFSFAPLRDLAKKNESHLSSG